MERVHCARPCVCAQGTREGDHEPAASTRGRISGEVGGLAGAAARVWVCVEGTVPTVLPRVCICTEVGGVRVSAVPPSGSASVGREDAAAACPQERGLSYGCGGCVCGCACVCLCL